MDVMFYDLKLKKLVPYAFNEHSEIAYKFLGWKENEDWIIVVGPYESEMWLHEQLYERVMKTGDESMPARNPDAAGDISFSEIVGWSSGGFEVKTPNEAREMIANALGMEFEG